MHRHLLHFLGPALVLASPILLGARGCGGSDVPIGGDCADSECGVALGAPAIECSDGSIGGNTGRCLLREDGTCGWEVRDCPPPPTPDECSAEECGVAPAVTAPTHCERGADGACRWVIDDDGCEASDCGPAPGTPSWTCADGTIGGFTGRCLASDETGACGWEIVDCAPTGDCTLEECGPASEAPACTCADGTLGCNTDRCLRDEAGECGWEWRECPASVSCGGLAPDGSPGCAENEFCSYTPEDICGAADATGTCTRRPALAECDADESVDVEVCGCDGVTYPSECHAWVSGTSAIPGACGSTGSVSCDGRRAVCAMPPPVCATGQVPSVPGGCWGPCVAIERCAPMACSPESPCPDGAIWSCEVSPDGASTCVAR
jgi:hypothetical protein